MSVSGLIFSELILVRERYGDRHLAKNTNRQIVCLVTDGRRSLVPLVPTPSKQALLAVPRWPLSLAALGSSKHHHHQWQQQQQYYERPTNDISRTSDGIGYHIELLERSVVASTARLRLERKTSSLFSSS